MKVNPKHYPLIIFLAYVFGVVVAILLGFLPKHGGEEAFFLPIAIINLFGSIQYSIASSEDRDL